MMIQLLQKMSTQENTMKMMQRQLQQLQALQYHPSAYQVNIHLLFDHEHDN